MNRNTLIGFSLIAVVLIAFSYMSSPSQAEIDAYNHEQDSIAAVKMAQEQQQIVQDTLKGQKAVAAIDSAALFFPSMSDSLAGVNSLVTLKNDSLELTFNTQGGTIASARILGHKDTLNNMGVQLFTENGQHMDFIIKGLKQYINTRDLYFTPTQEADGSLTMTAQAQGNGQLIFKYRLGPDYMLHFSMQAVGLGDQLDPTNKEVVILWQDSCRQQERGFTFENQRSALTYKFHNGGTDYLSETSEKKETTEEPIDWVAFKNQYFSAVLISRDAFNTGAELASTPLDKSTRILKNYDARLTTKFDPTGASGLPGMASIPLHQPLVHTVCLRLAHEVGSANGYCFDSHHNAAETHYLPHGEEELYVKRKDARSETQTRRSNQAVQQARGSDAKAAGHDATLCKIRSISSGWLSANADSDAYLDCDVQLRT